MTALQKEFLIMVRVDYCLELLPCPEKEVLKKSYCFAGDLFTMFFSVISAAIATSVLIALNTSLVKWTEQAGFLLCH